MSNPAVRRAALMLVATAAAIVGLVLLVVAWTGVARDTITATDDGDTPCLVAFGAADGPLQQARLHYDVMPPRSVCSWVVDGTREEVVVAQASSTVVVAGVVLFLVGAAGAVTLYVQGRRRSAA